MGEQKKELTDDEEFDEAFVDEPPEKKADEKADEKGSGEDDKSKEAKTEEEAKAEAEAKAKEEADEKGDDKKPPVTKEEVDWEKRFKDTQGAFTKSQQELAEIKKTVDDLKATDDKGKEKKPDELPEAVKEFLDDYPELKDYIDHKFTGSATEDDAATKEELDKLRAEIGQSNYDTALIGGFIGEDNAFVKGHPDAWEIMATPEYTDFHKEATKAKDPLLQSSNPADGIKFITKFKEEVLKKGTAAHDEKTAKEKEDADKALESAADQTQHGARTPADAGKELLDQQDEFDTVFDEIP